MKLSPTYRRVAVVGVAALLSATMAACGGAATEPAAVPSAASSKEPLKIGSDISFAPWESYDNSNNVVGIDADVAKALSKELDRPIEWVNIGYSSLIPSLAAGRFDFILSFMSDKPDKRENVSFVDYASPSHSFMVPKGNPDNIHSLADACGLTASQAAGSSTEIHVQEASKACEASGKPPINIVSVKLSSDIAQGLKSGRADFWLDDVISQGRALEGMDGKFEVVKAEGVPRVTIGMGFPKKSVELRDQIQQALQKLMDDGELKKIAEKNNIPPEVFLTEATVDQGK